MEQVTFLQTFTQPQLVKRNNDGEGDIGQEMSFSIEKISIAAGTRALKGSYSMELAQDLRAVHGLDAEGELANILFC